MESAVGEIERLERRIALDTTTLTSVTHSLAKLELRDRELLLASIIDVVCHSVGATNFAIYLKGEHGLEPALGVQSNSRIPSTAISPLAQSLLDEIHVQPRPGELRRRGVTIARLTCRSGHQSACQGRPSWSVSWSATACKHRRTPLSQRVGSTTCAIYWACSCLAPPEPSSAPT